MSISLQFSGYDIVVKHLHKTKSSKNWYYIRRIPKEFQHLYPDSKDHTIRFSTRTANEKEATKVAVDYNKELEKFWLKTALKHSKIITTYRRQFHFWNAMDYPPPKPLRGILRRFLASLMTLNLGFLARLRIAYIKPI